MDIYITHQKIKYFTGQGPFHSGGFYISMIQLTHTHTPPLPPKNEEKNKKKKNKKTQQKHLSATWRNGPNTDVQTLQNQLQLTHRQIEQTKQTSMIKNNVLVGPQGYVHTSCFQVEVQTNTEMIKWNAKSAWPFTSKACLCSPPKKKVRQFLLTSYIMNCMLV